MATYRLYVNILEQLGYRLTAEINSPITDGSDNDTGEIYSLQYVIGGLVSIQLMLDYEYEYDYYVDSANCGLYVRFQNYQNNSLRFVCRVFEEYSNEPLLFTMDSNPHWSILENVYLEGRDCFLNKKLFFTIELMPSVSKKFLSLYNDEDLADFKLCAEYGTITVHRVVLAAHSPVLKTMLATGTWKDTNEGHVNVTGTTAQTLEHLKKYLYLDQLPDTADDLKSLLLLSAVYMMKDLAQKCSAKILLFFVNENAPQYLQLACQYNIKTLLLGLTTLNMNVLTSSCDDERWL